MLLSSAYAPSSVHASTTAALPAALEICDELALPHVLLCHPANESPTCLTQRLALLELKSPARFHHLLNRFVVETGLPYCGN
jgi:hypothetical protein